MLFGTDFWCFGVPILLLLCALFYKYMKLGRHLLNLNFKRRSSINDTRGAIAERNFERSLF